MTCDLLFVLVKSGNSIMASPDEHAIQKNLLTALIDNHLIGQMEV